MNNDLEQFSEERLKEIANLAMAGAIEVMELARIALAAKQAKPAGYLENGKGFMYEPRHKELIKNPTPAYTTPQPAHTEQSGWIKCSERMPEDARDVTLMSKEHGVVNGYYWSGKHWGKDVIPSWFISCGTHEGKADDITHWMPLPAQPKPESE